LWEPVTMEMLIYMYNFNEGAFCVEGTLSKVYEYSDQDRNLAS